MDGIDLKVERIRSRVSQSLVASLLGRSNAWLYLIESGRRLPSENEIQAIRQAIKLAASGETSAQVQLCSER